MDGQGGGAHQARPGDAGRGAQDTVIDSKARFAEILQEVDHAALEWGIQPHHPEGRFVSALLGTVGFFGELHEAAMRRLEAVSVERAAVAKMQLDAAVEIRRQAEAAAHQARTAMIQEEVIRETLVVRMIDKTFPMFAERLQKCLFIKEWVVNTDRRQRRMYLHFAIAVVVVGVCYAAGRFDQPGPSQNEAIGAYCHRTVFGSEGHVYCLMDPFIEKSQ